MPAFVAGRWLGRIGAGSAVVVLAALLSPASARSAEPAGSILAAYDFDDEAGLVTGPDTFAIFQHARGTARLSSELRFSGYRSLELRDVAGDGSMPEIQGYLPLRSRGSLFAHFAFLSATPAEEWNFALAGPAWFRLAKDGIGFWLQARDGWLQHWSDSNPRRLFRLEGFVWYTADVAYDVTAGVYDLTIRREGQDEPLVLLRHVPGAASQPGSAVDKFSFVGEPFGDSSNVVYYVDDIVIGTDEQVAQHAFVAPGRRKLFVDRLVEYRRQQAGRPRCLPALDVTDFGLDSGGLPALIQSGLVESLAAASEGRAASGSPDPSLRALGLWGQGCQALERGQASTALARFVQARDLAPGARIHELSAALALVALGRSQEASQRLFAVRAAWGDDARYAAALAVAGTALGDLARAEDALRRPAEGEPGPDALAAGVSERYYDVLVWNDRAALARDHALREVQRAGGGSAFWLARAGDAALLLRDLREARLHYEQALALSPGEAWVALTLADVAHLEGDRAGERRLRERVYGALRAR